MQGAQEMWRLAICSLFLLLLSGLDALTKTDTFRYSGFRGWSKFPPLVSKTAVSKVMCATRCAQNAACKSFSFRTGTEGCSLFPRRIEALDVDLSVSSEDAHYSRVLASCPAWMGYITVPGTTKCIRVVGTKKRWPEAAETCAEDGGHLLIIENADVMQKLQGFLGQGMYFVGFNDVDTEDVYLWLDRTPVNRALFYITEPSERRTLLSEDYGMLLVKGTQPGLHDFVREGEEMFLCSLPTEE